MGEPSVSVVVLNYNGKEHLAPCLESLQAIEYARDRLELVVLDNASTDGSCELVRSEFPDVRVIESETNRGFAGGNNLAARAVGGEYVVFLNNDMAVEPGFVSGLIEAVQSRPEVASAAAKILNWDGSAFDFCGGILNFAGHAAQVGFGEPFDEDAYNDVTSTAFACGGAMIVRRDVFLDLGGFDEDYFIYFEDVDLGWRLWLYGWDVVFAPRAVVRHRHHGTMSRFSNYRRTLLYQRNALATLFKNYSDEHMLRMLSSALLMATAGISERAIVRGAVERSVFQVADPRPLDAKQVAVEKDDIARLLAIYDFVDWLPALREKRAEVQGRRVRSDEELAHLFRPWFPPVPAATTHTRESIASAFGVDELFRATPRKVLVVGRDGSAAAGERAWLIREALAELGHEALLVTMSPTGGAQPASTVAARNGEVRTTSMLIREAEADVVVLCGSPPGDDLHQDAFLRVPLIVDLQGPGFDGADVSRGNGDGQLDELAVLRQADFCTSVDEASSRRARVQLRDAGWTDEEIEQRVAVLPLPSGAAGEVINPNGELERLDEIIRRLSIRGELELQFRGSRLRRLLGYTLEAYREGGLRLVVEKARRFHAHKLWRTV